MANPVLNERALQKAASSWAPPQRGTAFGDPGYAVAKDSDTPVHDGPISPWKGAMTVRGTASATATLFASRVPRVMLLAAIIGMAAATVGLLVSYHANTAPGATMSLVISPGDPAATHSTSAARVSDGRSIVLLWQSVTVAFRWVSIVARGRPTTLERPTTVTRAPSRVTP